MLEIKPHENNLPIAMGSFPWFIMVHFSNSGPITIKVRPAKNRDEDAY